jgi:hypothetical protein
LLVASLRTLRTNFDADLNRATALTRAVALPHFQAALISELAFLRCFLAWEVLLEESFYQYALGRPAPSGARFPCYLTPNSMEHAKQVIRGGRGFVTWTDSSRIIERAEMFLRDGEPYATALGTISSDLADMVKIRNRIAHRSERATEDFLALVRRKRGYVPQGESPGRFLRGTDAGAADRRFDVYVAMLRITAAQIVPT